MKVLLSWLKEFIDIDDSLDSIANNLTMVGLEVEAIELLQDDAVLELNVTPNRGDCLSIVGIARELSAIYQRPLTLPEHDVIAELSSLNFNVDIIDTDLCYRYVGRLIRNVKIAPSPQWMQKRLQLCGIRALNNVVDITNYVLLELGHPLHAFDADLIEGNLIRVGTPNSIDPSYKIFTTLDGQQREIKADTLLIWDAVKPVAIAGVMGGLQSEVTDKTVNIFLESAWFAPSSIRKTSKALGLKTEASYRFERTADIKMLKKALDRASLLLKTMANGSVHGKIDIYPKRYIPVTIKCRSDVISKVIGISFTAKEITHYLKRLHMDVKELSDKVLEVIPPPYRSDIQAEIDIVEEVARLHGFNNITSILPTGLIGFDSEHLMQKNRVLSHRERIKETMMSNGFFEAINLSFMSLSDVDGLRLPKDDPRRNALPIRNPLTVEASHMRTTLLPALLKNLRHNLSHGIKELRLFEMAKVFLPDQNISANPRDKSLPAEKLMLGAVFYKERHKELYADNTEEFYILKGALQNVLRQLGIVDSIYKRSLEPFLHPGKSADIYVKSSDSSTIKIGYIGAVSYSLIEGLEIKASKPALAVFEIDLDSIITGFQRQTTFKPLPRYPHIERDTAIIVDVNLDAQIIYDILQSFDSDIIESFAIFDIYQGQGLPQGKKSIAYNVCYRSADKTLKDDEVQALHERLTSYVLLKTSGQLR